MKVKAFTGIMLTLFLVVTLFAAIPIGHAGWDDEIHIAVVGPQGWIQWDGIWVGCVLARDLINLGPNGIDDGGDGDDGIVIGGFNYKVVLKAVDSHAVPEPEPAAGWAELFAALEPPFSADFVIGGFRTECVAPMRLNFLQYANAKYEAEEKVPIWFIAGASTDELIDCGGTGACGGTCVRCNYDLGRYMFRITPMSSTWLFKQFAGFMRMWVLPFKLGPLYGGNVIGTDPGPLVDPINMPGVRLYRDVLSTQIPLYENPIETYLVMEDLTWTISMGLAVSGSPLTPYPPAPDVDSVLGPNAIVVGYDRTHALTPQFDPVFQAIDTEEAKLIVHIYSAVTGVDFIKTWRERGTKAVPVGINVESQMMEFWDSSGGKCEYESFLASLGTRTNISPNAKPLSTEELWDLYEAKSGDILTAFWGAPMPSTAPIYTMWGAYDAIIGMNETLPALGTTWNTNVDTLIAAEESTNRLGVLGMFNFSDLIVPGDGKGHDVNVMGDAVTPNWPSGQTRSHIPQWQNGKLEVVFPRDQRFSRRYLVPPWMYSLAETDVANADGFGPDGTVGVLDMGMLSNAWLTIYGVVGWNMEVDMDNNGVINIFDASRIAKDWGKNATPQ